MSDWKVIIPQAATNYVLNPVAQGAGNYAAISSASATTDSTYSYSGYKCFKVENTGDNDGVSFTLGTLANAIHYVTIRTYGTTSAWDWSLDNTNWSVPALVRTEGNWSVYGCEFAAARSSGSTTLYVQKNTAGAATWYIGHVQVESGSVDTTPITGDMKGFCSDGYYWNGTPHASTSTRVAKERKGGLLKDLATDYNFKVRYGVGSGMPPLTHYVQGMALLPGALYQGHHVEPRTLDLVSIANASTAANVVTARKNFINAVKPDRVSPEQPVVFWYTGANANRPVQFYGYYDSGMEFQITSGLSDKPEARFICYDPFAYELETQSAVLTTSLSVANANYIFRRNSGVWTNISTDFDSTISSIVQGQDGCIYMGGAFTLASASASADYIAKYDPSTTDAMTPLGTGGNAAVNTLALAPNGYIYAGGAFTAMGGVANTNKIACWTTTAATVEWVTVGNGITCASADVVVNALTFDQAGSLYVGGLFADQVDANGDNITKYTIDSVTVEYVSLGTGCNGQVNALATAPNGDIYAGGAFSLAGGVSNTAYIAYWDIDPASATAEWKALGTGISGGTPVVNAIIFDQSGNLIVGGNFTTADGIACLNIAKWNGKTFEPLGSGVNNTVNTLTLDKNGLLYVGGTFTAAGGLSIAGSVAVWNGSTWANIGCNLNFATSITDLEYFGENLYVASNFAGTAILSKVNTITNNSSKTAYPVIKVNRANDGKTAELQYIKNETTGATLWCSYNLMGGETLTIDLTPGARRIYSSAFGDVWRTIFRNSDLSSFNLLPGTNNISAFVYTTGSSTVTAWMEWPITHWAAEGAGA